MSFLLPADGRQCGFFPQRKTVYTVLGPEPRENRTVPKLSNSLPKYRASGQAIVTLHGLDYYLGPHDTMASKKQYDRLIGEWLANGRSPLHVSAQDITVVELSARYWKFARSYYRKDGRCTGVAPAIKRALTLVNSRYGRRPNSVR